MVMVHSTQGLMIRVEVTLDDMMHLLRIVDRSIRMPRAAAVSGFPRSKIGLSMALSYAQHGQTCNLFTWSPYSNPTIGEP